jgi:hypothetical protein
MQMYPETSQLKSPEFPCGLDPECGSQAHDGHFVAQDPAPLPKEMVKRDEK